MAVDIKLTFDDMVRLEPRLGELLTEVTTARPRTYSKAGQLWYGTYKRRLVALVGFMSEHPDGRLHTSQAYDMAYGTLTKAIGIE